jgi:hypothetical protein
VPFFGFHCQLELHDSNNDTVPVLIRDRRDGNDALPELLLGCHRMCDTFTPIHGPWLDRFSAETFAPFARSGPVSNGQA